jgi:hypothetical protein
MKCTPTGWRREPWSARVDVRLHDPGGFFVVFAENPPGS